VAILGDRTITSQKEAPDILKAEKRKRLERALVTAANNLLLYRIKDVNKHCLEEFRKHWTCLDNNNQQLWQCRPAEWKLNKCVFDNLVT
jgi:hypothetical protein